MASTEKLPSGKYRGIYYDSAGQKRHTPAKDRKKDALADARDAEVKAKRQASAKKGTLPGHTTWAEWCEVWWAKRKLEENTEINQIHIRDRELIPVWGDTPLNQIERGDIQDWVERLEKRKKSVGATNATNSAGYVLIIYGVFRASMLAAVEAGVLVANPCTKIRLPKPPKARKRVLEQAEYEALLGQLRPRHKQIVEFLRETGLRPAELAGLHWDHVSLDTGWVTVAEVLVRASKSIKGTPKDDDSRDVPLTSRAIEILKLWKEEIPQRHGCGLVHTDGKACRSDLVVRQKNDKPICLQSLQETFSNALVRAQVAHARPYDLRHLFATKLAEAGVDPFEIARLLGHASVAQSVTYIHRTAAARQRVLAALGDPAATGLRVVSDVGRGTDRGTSAPSSALPETPSESAPHAS